MQYTLRTLLILLLLGPPTLARLHVAISREVSEELLPRLTSGWGIGPKSPCGPCIITVTPRIMIQEEDEEKLGIDLVPQDGDDPSIVTSQIHE